MLLNVKVSATLCHLQSVLLTDIKGHHLFLNSVNILSTTGSVPLLAVLKVERRHHDSLLRLIFRGLPSSAVGAARNYYDGLIE